MLADCFEVGETEVHRGWVSGREWAIKEAEFKDQVRLRRDECRVRRRKADPLKLGGARRLPDDGLRLPRIDHIPVVREP